MDVVGCGCMGFSFTSKYKFAIISLSNMINELGSIGVIDYQDLQSRIANKGISAESEIRMIIPFLVKANVINENNCIKTSTGSRIRKFVIDEKFFTDQGIEFIKVLQLECNKKSTNDTEVIEKIDALYHKAGMYLFLSLCKSSDYIYRELFFFLKKYKTIDKNEFYLLTNSYENSQMDKLSDLIDNYRKGKIGEIKIIRNVNDWQYLMSTLQQFGLITLDEKRYMLTKDAMRLEIGNE